MHEIEGYRLFNGVKAGDESAFSLLIKEYQDLLYMEAVRILKNKAEAEDAVQEIFIKIWLKRETLDLHTSLRNYLYIAIKNYCLQVLRDNNTVEKRKKKYSDFKETIISPSELENKELGNHLKKAIESLNPARQAAFDMHYLAGINQQEIARQKRISVQTVKNHVSAALKDLRKMVSRNY